MLKLREELLSVEEDRISGSLGCTLDELDKYLDDIIEEVWCIDFDKTNK